MSEPGCAQPTGTAAPEVRRAQSTTWVSLVVITVGTAIAVLLDEEANPIGQGLFAVVAALEMMIALLWWRSARRRGTR
ncbi:hypothetical protein [Blastococcus mobilis]|uniref:Uncharacterized protein n=1 Tax=Blastococcus mobilis TaxID=1938746 RepID=A0A238VFR7_9ACTN|nr:hypothetical protein [Blastococcus mobilis]SNR33235.1 hypothetical protein SAMN06272737_103107 [Blastococcus mobilis]